jgi:hypothetical protein
MEFTRLAILYLHLIACCAAIGLVLTSDIAMVRKLLGANYKAPDDISHLYHVKEVVSVSLIALWITGIALVSMDYRVNGMSYFENPKLQAKVAIVVLLTMNGFVLHRAVLPVIEKYGALLNLPRQHLIVALFAGSVSGVSWLYAAMLGVGRPLAWKYSLLDLLVAYPVLIACGILGMLGLTLLARLKGAMEYRPARI